MLGLTRVAVTEGGQGTLGPRLDSRGTMRGWAAVAQNLERWARDGRLAIDDPLIAALHLKGLLEAGVAEPRLYGSMPAISADEAARRSVRIFLAGHRSEAHTRP